MSTGQGSQFTSFYWIDHLTRAKTRISIDGKVRYVDNTRAFLRTDGRNALDMSHLWRSLKYACVSLRAWETGSQAKAGVARGSLFQPPAAPRRQWRTTNRRGLLQRNPTGAASRRSRSFPNESPASPLGSNHLRRNGSIGRMLASHDLGIDTHCPAAHALHARKGIRTQARR